MGSWVSVSELEYSLSVENIQISLYAHARQSLLLLTHGNIYNRLRFLNKYLMLLEELNELFPENCSKFLNAGYLVFWKKVPGCSVSRHELDYFHNYYWVMSWISAASLPKWLDFEKQQPMQTFNPRNLTFLTWRSIYLNIKEASR